jgi:CHAT domain-containing protein
MRLHVPQRASRAWFSHRTGRLRPCAVLALTLLVTIGSEAEQPAGQEPGRARSPRARVDILRTVDAGDAAVRAGDLQTATRTFEPLIEDVERLGDPDLLARALAGLGWAQWANARYAASLETRMRALEVVRTRRNPVRETYILRGLGETLYALGRYDEALTRYREGLDLAERQAVTREQGLILSNMGSTYRNLGRLDDALAATEQSVAMLRPLNEPRDLIQPLMVSGIVSRALGRYDRSIDHYTEALSAARRVADRRWESQLLGNMGNVYLDLSRYETAIGLYRQSLLISDEIGYTAQSGFNHQNIATVLNRVSRPTDALPHFEAALEIWRTADRRPQIATTLLNVGVLELHARRDGVGARRSLDEALTIAREIREMDLVGHALLNLGDVDHEAGRYEQALQRYDQALAELQTPRSPGIEYQLLEGRGAVLRRLGRLDDAIAALRASAAIVSDLRANVSSDESKIAFLDTRQSVFQHLASALVDARRVDEAFEAAEAVRARALADLMNDRNLQSPARDRPALRALRTAIATRAPEPDLAAALAELRLQNSELASLVAAETPSAREARAIAARLNDATIVEYLVTPESVLAFVVRPDAIRARRISVTSQTLDAGIRDLLEQLARPSHADPQQARRLDSRLRDLHRLVRPIADLLPTDPAAPVVVVPHGALTRVPFAALLDDGGAAMVERHTLSYTPSLSVLRYTEPRRTRTDRPKRALVVADPVLPGGSGLEPLPASLEEGRAIRKRLAGTDALLLSGPVATEAAVKRSIASRQVVHLATHGLVSEQRPLASSLVFGEGEGEDGYLRADEIFGLELDADLVVLSGCSTGLGRLSGEGLLGLTRSFFFAGTRSLVVSYWDISDAATVALMDRFYAGLERGMSKAAALRAAQIETRRRLPHPAFWAAFVLQGEPD